MAIFTGVNNLLKDGAAIIIKRGSNYTPTGLDGFWFYSTHNQYGFIQIDGIGNVTDGNWFAYDGINIISGEITGGSFTFNSQGQLSGTVTSDFPDTVTFIYSQVDEYKEIGAATVSDSYGGHSNMLIVKADNTFTTSDLEGTWHLATYYGPGDISYSTMIVDSSGNVTGGSFHISYGNITYTGGSLAIDEDGYITGQVQTSDGHVGDVFGQMNANKDFANMHLIDVTAPKTAVAAAVRLN